MRYLCFMIVSLMMVAITSADYLPPSPATAQVSENGKVLVRLRQHHLLRYEVDDENDVYRLIKRTELGTEPPQFLYVSDSGDVVAIYLSGTAAAIELYGTDGQLRKSWKLEDFMSAEQINACPQTAASTQWIKEAFFLDREFGFIGPSRRIRRLGSYTVTHSGDPNMVFAYSIDCKTGKLSEINMDGEEQSADRPAEPVKDPSYRSYDGQPNPIDQ